MADILKSIQDTTAVVRRSVQTQSDALIRRASESLALRDDPLAMGMLFIMQKMSHLIDRSFDLVDAQLEESRLQREVLELEKALLEKKLAKE